MCSSGCCIKDLRWQNGVLQMLKGGSWSDVPGGEPITSGGVPNLPPVDPDEVPTASLSCSKANGIWAIINQAMSAFVDVFTGEIGVGYAEMQMKHPEVNWDNYRLFTFSLGRSIGFDWDTLAEDWAAHGDGLKDSFICYMQDAFSKTTTLTDPEYTMVLEYDFDSPSALLDDFLTDMLRTVEKVAYQESAAYFASEGVGECDCVGSVPPDPDATPEGYGRILHYFAQSLVNADFPDTIPAPEDFIASVNPAGELIAPTTAASTYIASTDNQGLSIMFAAPDGVIIKKLKFTAHWTTGTAADKEFDSGLAYSTALDSNFGAISEGHVESMAIAAPDNVVDDLSAYNARYVWKNWACYGTDESDENALQMSNIRFDLAASDASWTRNDVPLGELFQL